MGLFKRVKPEVESPSKSYAVSMDQVVEIMAAHFAKEISNDFPAFRDVGCSLQINKQALVLTVTGTVRKEVAT